MVKLFNNYFYNLGKLIVEIFKKIKKFIKMMENKLISKKISNDFFFIFVIFFIGNSDPKLFSICISIIYKYIT
jgi:hypothetical protein